MKKQVIVYRRIILLMGIVFLISNVIIGGLFINANSNLEKNVIEFEKVNKQLEKIKEENDKLKEENDKLKKNNNELKDQNNRLVKSNGSGKKIIYLTFDDGPSKNTQKIIDVLKAKNVKGTFFVVNKPKQGYLNILNSGNAIGLHTFTHDYNKIYQSSDAFIKDLTAINQKVLKATGKDIKTFRFAGGSSNSFVGKANFKRIVEYLKNNGYEYFDWNCDSTDALSTNISVSKIIENSISCGKERVINLLIHDGGGHENTVKALPQIIDFYKKKGFEFRVIDNKAALIQHRR